MCLDKRCCHVFGHVNVNACSCCHVVGHVKSQCKDCHVLAMSYFTREKIFEYVELWYDKSCVCVIGHVIGKKSCIWT